jgi:hypothetical protein
MAFRHPEDEQPPKAHTIAKAIFCSMAVDTYQTVAADQRSTRPERISPTEAALTAKLRLTRHTAVPALATHLRPRTKKPRATNSPDARPKAKPRTDSSRSHAQQRQHLNSTDARSDPPPVANNTTAIANSGGLRENGVAYECSDEDAHKGPNEDANEGSNGVAYVCSDEVASKGPKEDANEGPNEDANEGSNERYSSGDGRRNAGASSKRTARAREGMNATDYKH